MGTAVRTAVGASVGTAVGASVGASVGRAVGASVGRAVGAAVGTAVGAAVGAPVGIAVGVAAETLCLSGSLCHCDVSSDAAVNGTSPLWGGPGCHEAVTTWAESRRDFVGLKK